MNLYRQAPIVRLLIPFLLGILFSSYLPHSNKEFFYLLIVLGFISIVVLAKYYLSGNAFKNGWRFGLLVNILLFFIGVFLVQAKTEKYDKKQYGIYASTASEFLVNITNAVEEKEHSVKAQVEVVGVKKDSAWIDSKGKLLVYLEKNALASDLKYGDRLLIQTKVYAVQPPKNPGEFDYQKYLSHRHVYYQTYVKENAWKKVDNAPLSLLKSFALGMRENLLELLHENNISGKEYAIASALLLGNRTMIDDETLEQYSDTGIVHILSVSGLHVGIVYAFLNWLLSFLEKAKRGKILKAIFILSFLLFYSFLTGLSPSVLRASLMFSFLVVANALDRDTNIYNTIAASAFVLLLIDPYYVYNVGFQLSYIAVVGIVYLQPRIANWFVPNSYFLQKLWVLVSVAIAAQVVTFPLVIYYFHKFPNYFLLANIIAIPLATCILYGGILLFAFSKITLLTSVLSLFLKKSLELLNFTVQQICSLPGSIKEGIYFSSLDVVLLYLLISVLLIYFYRRQVALLLLSFAVLFLFIANQAIREFKQTNQKNITFYSVPKSGIVEFTSGQHTVCLLYNGKEESENQFNYFVGANRIRKGIERSIIAPEKMENENLYINNHWIQFYSKKLAIANNNAILEGFSNELDYLLIGNDWGFSMRELLENYRAKMLIFDSSCSKYKLKKWIEECKLLEQNFYSLPDNGALVVDL